jgi:hypothetical protein
MVVRRGWIRVASLPEVAGSSLWPELRWGYGSRMTATASEESGGGGLGQENGGEGERGEWQRRARAGEWRRRRARRVAAKASEENDGEGERGEWRRRLARRVAAAG